MKEALAEFEDFKIGARSVKAHAYYQNLTYMENI